MRRLPLLLDVALAALFLLLDLRDLWFKLQWVGTRDAFAFSTVETRSFPASNADPLKPTTIFAYADQKTQRVSGWSSFLQQCESLVPLPEDDETRGFKYALGKNCMIGTTSRAVRAQELLLTGSIRVDSMAWAACELLYKNRKPPICHSPIVTQFRERYNIQNELVIGEQIKTLPGATGFQDAYAAKPGSDTEADLVDLLEVVSKSSPISATTCVEGFIVKGSARYTASVFGCGSSNFYRSVFVGSDISMFTQFQRDKAWLTTESLSVVGMSLLVRGNRRSIYTVNESTIETGGKRVLEHVSLHNFSSSGSLYTAMILVDLTLLALSICSIVEITRFMLWPLWKPLIASEYQTSSTRATKMGFVLEDYAHVLQVGSLRSTPVVLLTVLSRLMSWALIAPSIMVWGGGKFDIGDVHAFLTMIRVGDLAALCVNFLWGIVVFCDEKHALGVVRKTYVSLLEFRCVGAATVFLLLVSQSGGARYRYDRQRIIDRTTFENVTIVANTLLSDLDARKNTPPTTLFEVYYPFLVIIGVIMLIVSLLLVLRYSAGTTSSRSLVQSVGGSVYVQPRTTNESPSRKVQNDLSSNSAGILMRSASPPPSPTRETPPFVSTAKTTDAHVVEDDRLPFEKLMNSPIRARSLIRSSWALEKMSGGQLLLLPSSYLEYGVVLIGRFMKTRCGFMDVVRPILHVQEHQRTNGLEEESQSITENNSTPSLR